MEVVNASRCGGGTVMRQNYHQIRSIPPHRKNWTFFRSNAEEKVCICAGSFRTITSAAIFSPQLKLANALTYEELLEQAAGSPDEPPADFDVNGVAESVSNFSSENPLVILAGVALVMVPFILSQVLQKPKRWGTMSAPNVYSALQNEDAQLLDIRSSEDLKRTGSPDLRAFRKRAVQLFYSGGKDAPFLQRVCAKFKDPPNTTLYILDKFDGSSVVVAKLLSENGFNAAYAIKGGAEGNNGWQSSELPWLITKKKLTFDLGGLKQIIDRAMKENPGLIQVTLVVTAATGFGLVAFSEVETALQLLGSAALAQLFVKKLLFAEDRRRTFEELESFIDTEVAQKELVSELKGIGNALLPKTIDASLDNDVANSKDQKTDTSAILVENAEVNENQTPEPASMAPSDAELGSSSATQSATIETKPTLISDVREPPPSSRPLSPFPRYPDFKPVTSPTPSRP